jgi:hypothetical protein
MNIHIHPIGDTNIAEITAGGFIINDIEDGTDLVGNLCFQGIDKVVLYEQNITANFFDLKTGVAGEILQKFTNYRVRLAIVGDFIKYTSKSLQDFIFESNKHKQVNFVSSLQEAMERLVG